MVLLCCAVMPYRMLTAFVSSSTAGSFQLLEGAKVVAPGSEGEGRRERGQGEGESAQPSTSALMAVLVQSYEKEVRPC